MTDGFPNEGQENETCEAGKRGANVRRDFSWNGQPVAMMGYR